MVAVVSGSMLGLTRSSVAVIGSGGILGSGGLGRAPQGVTVNAASGNLVIQTQDEFLAGLGLGAAISSSYNSLGAQAGNYTNLDGSAEADGWLLSTQRRVRLIGTANTAGSTIKLTDADGSVVAFTYNTATARYQASEAPYSDDLLTLAGNILTYVEGKSRSTQTFDLGIGGRLADFRDADGNTLTFTYSTGDTSGRLVRVTTANSSGGQNGFVDYNYDGSGRLTSLSTYYWDAVTATNKSISRVSYTYDTANRLSSVSTDLTPLNGADSAFYTITYTYKDSTSKLVTGITQSDGTSLTIVYDASNRVSTLTQIMDSGVSQVTTFSYDSANRVTTITDALSNQYKMGYDTLGQLIRLDEPAPVSGGNPTIKTYAYDAQGNVTEALTFDNPANVGNASLAIEVTRSRYDPLGNLLERVLADGSATVYLYDSANQIISETRYSGFDSNGLADGVAPTGGMTTSFVYDAAGNGIADDGSEAGDDAAEAHLRFAISAEGRVTEYRYNAAGQLIATIRYAGNAHPGTVWTESALASWVAGADRTQVERTDHLYDIRGALIQTTSYSATDSAGAGLTTANWSRAEYTYDQAGRMLSRRVSGTNDLGGEAVPVTEIFVYDGLGRVISTTDTLGQTTTISIDDGTRTTTITTPNAATQTQIFKISGAIASASATAAGTATATSLYAYDALGRLRMATDASGLKTYYVYDRQNRLTATIDDNGTLSEIKYDGANRVVASVTYANAVSAANLVLLGTITTNTEVATIRPAVSAADRWQWTIYDKTGKVLQTIDAAGAVVKYDYDGAGRLLATTAYFNVIDSSTINGVNGISGYRASAPTSVVSLVTNVWADRVNQNFYNADSLLVATVLQLAGSASGRVVEYGYDRAGRLVETIQYANTIAAASWQGKTLSQIKTALVLDSASDSRSYRLYDGRGRVGATIDGEGNVTRYHYTAAGNVDQEIRGQQVSASTAYTLATLPAASGTIETTRFYYNAAGLVTSQVRTLTGGTETTSYTYDSRGRLLSQTTSETVSSEARTQTMRYDAKGRLTGQLSGVGSAALAALGASPAQNLIDTVYATHGTQYIYDIADRLIQTITPDGSGTAGVKTLYYYDADGQLRFTINALGEVSEHRYNVLEDRTETIVYGTRLSSGTLATLSGGLVTATITNAVLPVVQGGIGDASKDSRLQATFDNRGLLSSSIDALGNTTTFQHDPFGHTGTVTGSVLAGPNVARTDTTGFYTDGQLWYSTSSVNGIAAATLWQSYSYDGLGRLFAHTQNNYDQRTERWWYDRAGRNTIYRDNYYNAATSTYDPRSNLISNTDRAGKTSTFAYDLFNRTVTSTSAEGIVSSVKRNAYGQTILITDGKGQTTSYSYDKNGNLKTVTDPAGTTTSDYDNAGRVIDVTDANGVKTRYSYDAVGRVLTEVRDHGAGKLNLTTTYAYDAKGQTISVTGTLGVVTTYGYDLKGQKVTVVQDAGVGKSNLTTQYTYRADGKVVAQIEAFGTAQARTTQFEYDTYGRLTKTVADAGSGNNALGIAYANAATFYYYDVNNNQIARTDALGRTTRFIFDANNRLTLTIDAEGEVAQTIYDAEDRAIATRRFVSILTGAQLAAMADKSMPDQWNELTTATNGDITITKKVKDMVSGVVTATTAGTLAANAGDRITRSFYDGDGRAVYGVDGEGYVTQNVYDKADNVIQTIRYALQTSLTNTSTTANVAALFTTTQVNGGLATGFPTDAVVTTYTYDGVNRLTDVTNAEGVTTHFVLDALGQISETHVAYLTAEVAVTKRSYDALGRLTSETRAFGQSEAATTQYVYDALGQLVKATDPRGNASFFYYDSLGRMNWSVDAEGFVTKTEYLNGTANTKVTRYAAKASNAATLTPATLPSVTADAARDAVSYAWYDGQDRLVWSVDAEGYVVKSTYLIGGVVASVTRYANKAGNFASLALGAPPTVTTSGADAASAFTYDLIDRVKTAADAEGKVESYAYDALGNRTSFTNKLGGVTNYTYDKRGLLKTEAADQKSYDSTGAALLEGVSAANRVVTSYSYDARGNLKTKVAGSNLTAANQLTTSFDYDKLDRVIRQTDPAVTNPDAAGTVTPISEWAYDKRGNVVQQKVKLDATTWASTTSWYDKLGRKAAEVSPVGTFSQWTYDASGNLLTQKVWSTGVAVPAAPGGVVPSASGAVRETRLAYDKNGRLIESKVIGVRTGAFNGTSYVTTPAQDLTSNNEYDAFGNLVKEIDANRNAIFHWYDKNGRELAKLDQESFLTTWSRDADGNVTSETRFAAKFSGAPNASAAAPTVTADAINDRTTTFTYDRMGRRLTEVRKAMLVATVTGNTVATASQDVTVAYAYNALGEVLSKGEATGDRTDYQYDVQGRLIRQLGAVQADFGASGTASVRHVTYFKYDGANNLVFATERAEAGTAVTDAAITPDAMGALASGYALGDDRTTKYLYSGGKLTGMTDAMNFTRSYTYDVAGRRVAEYYTRTKSDATTVTEGNFTGYDLAGRTTSQWQQVRSGSVWTALWPQTLLSYNAYGEVTARSIKASAADPSPLVQDQMVYDNAGRVVKTNAGDGVWKVMAYDANGNATLSLSAITADMSGAVYSIDTALATFAGSDPTSANATMVATISIYDKRNMATATYEPQRQIDATATRYTITRSRSYTAFGEVASETDARGNTTNYLYNTMGKATRSIAPTVSITNEDGTTPWVRPTSDYYYDKSGRLVATRDANGTYAAGGTSTAGTIKDGGTATALPSSTTPLTGNLTTRMLLAGTGYGGSEAKVLKEFRPDVSVWESQYDAFGQERVKIDGLNSAKKAAAQAYVTTQQQYDKAGQIIQITHMPTAAGALNEYFSYDGLGQKTKHWTSHYGLTVAATTDYDSLSRVVRTRAFGGDVTTTVYAWNNALTTNGMGISGVWVATTTMANGLTKVEKKDNFGHLTSQTNLGGAVTNFNYDRAGQITSYVNGTSSWNFVWFNNGKRYQVSQLNTAPGGLTTFGYDLDGRIVSEVMASYKNLTATYDASGRLTSWTKVVTTTSSTTTVEYDANGNVRAKILGVSADWFRYDSLNRLVTDKGSFGETVNSTTGRDPGTIQIYWHKGVNYTYDLNGNRKQAVRPPRGITADHVGETITYTYDNESHLTQAYIVTTTGSPREGFSQYIYTNTYGYDLLGRLTSGNEGASPGYSARNFTQNWNQKNQLATVTSSNPAVANSTSTTNYNYNSGLGQYLLGQIGSATTVQGTSTQTQTNEYDWYDGAVIKKTTVTGTGAQTPGVTTYTNDAYGLLFYASITGAQNYSNSYVYDAASQGIRKDVGGTYPYTLVTNRMGGVELVDPNGTTVEAPSSTSLGTYKVRSGDTLTSIAASLWGDSSLWYKLAEANGLTSQSNLVDGQSLTIPGGVYRTRQAADTFVPYDAGKFVGDTQPTAVFPKPKGGCGVFGMILMAVVAIAVTAWLGPQMIASMQSFFAGGALAGSGMVAAGAGTAAAIGGGIVGGAMAGAIASTASQLFGMATGIQQGGFNFKAVGLAALAGGIGGGLQGSGLFGKLAQTSDPLGKVTKTFEQGGLGIKSALVDAASRGMVASAATQVVGKLTGLQDKISWAGVAAAGISAGIAQAVGGRLTPLSAKGANTFNNHLAHLGTSGASMLANAATRSVVEGTDFGDNVLAALPDLIGQTIHDLARYSVTNSRPASQLDPQTASDLRDALDANDLGGLSRPGGQAVAGPQGNNPKFPAELGQIRTLGGNRFTGLLGPSYRPQVSNFGSVLDWLKGAFGGGGASSNGKDGSGDISEFLATFGQEIIVIAKRTWDVMAKHVVVRVDSNPRGSTVQVGVNIGNTSVGYYSSTQATNGVTQTRTGFVVKTPDFGIKVGAAGIASATTNTSVVQGSLRGPDASLGFEQRTAVGPAGTTTTTTLNATAGGYSLGGTVVYADGKQGTKLTVDAGASNGTASIGAAVRFTESSEGTTASVGIAGQYQDKRFVGGIAVNDFTGGTTIAGKFVGQDGNRSVAGNFVLADYTGGTRGSGGIAYNNGSGQTWAGGAAFVDDARGTGAYAAGGWVAPSQPSGPYGRFGSMQGLQQAGQVEYQRLVDQGYGIALAKQDRGGYRGPYVRRTMGNEVDAFSRDGMKEWFASEGIGLGASGPGVFVNNRLYNGDASKWRVPDIRIGDRIYDASLASKNENSSQVRDFYRFGNPRMVTIVRPTNEGGAYDIPRPRGQ